MTRTLALLARKGRLYDAEIERPFADLLTFDLDQRKSDMCAINHGGYRNLIVTESYRARSLVSLKNLGRVENAYPKPDLAGPISSESISTLSNATMSTPP